MMDIRPCVLIPVYNHASTLPAVVEAAAAQLPVIVVDDGSTDGAADWLKTRGDIRWTAHERNRGKGEALRTGFRLAAEAGFTHAITIDADGQHLPKDIPAFVQLCRERPEAVLVGVRDFAAAGAPSDRHAANRVSNFWFYAITGARLGDTQCGFRCYPLELVNSLITRAGRYGYELELLVRAAWAGRPLLPTPVGVLYSEQTVRGSHFRPVVDVLRIARLNARLLLQVFFVPLPLRGLLSTGALRAEPFWRKLSIVLQHVMGEHTCEPLQIGMAVGLGVFCAFAPIWGLQTVAAAVLAHALRLNKAVAVIACNVFWPLIPLIICLSLCAGHLLLHGKWVFFWDIKLTSDALSQYLLEYLVGAPVAGLAAALLSCLATWGVVVPFCRRKN